MDNIHLFTRITYIDHDGTEKFLNYEDFDASNKLEPGGLSKVKTNLPFYYGIEGQPKLNYYISFYAGQGGVVLQSVQKLHISVEEGYDVSWDGHILGFNPFYNGYLIYSSLHGLVKCKALFWYCIKSLIVNF